MKTAEFYPPLEVQGLRCGLTWDPPLSHQGRRGIIGVVLWQFAEKVIFCRLLKNAQMQGTQNPEE